MRRVKNYPTNEIGAFAHVSGAAEVTVKHNLGALKHKTVLLSTRVVTVRKFSHYYTRWGVTLQYPVSAPCVFYFDFNISGNSASRTV